MTATVDSPLGAARTLALTRIVAGLVIVFGADVHGAVRFAGLDPQLVSPPPGLAWLRILDLSPLQVTLLVWLVVVGALLGALGAYARASFALTAAGLFVLLALPHRTGAVIHSHHLLWAAALLAASPCADVWSVDAYFTPAPLRPRAQYEAPLAVFRALVACIYFFPGLYKLLAFASGTDPSAWMRSHLAWKWLQHGAAPPLFVNLSPAWFGPLALGALAFELSMPLLVAFRRTRPLALLGAIAFHVGTALLLFIRFDSLAAVLTPLLDLTPGVASRLSLRELVTGAQPATRWLGGLLVIGALATGVSGQTQLYPFACYPTFDAPSPPTMPSARVVVLEGERACPLARPSDSPGWIAAFRIAGAYGDVLTTARAEAYVRRVARAELRGSGCTLRPESKLALVLEALAWDFEARSARVVRQRLVYSAAASALGMAPAGGTSASSSPSR
ncbi:MAG TPA: HTTM domain-containing protein [Polyangiales bacterium]